MLMMPMTDPPLHHEDEDEGEEDDAGRHPSSVAAPRYMYQGAELLLTCVTGRGHRRSQRGAAQAPVQEGRAGPPGRGTKAERPPPSHRPARCARAPRCCGRAAAGQATRPRGCAPPPRANAAAARGAAAAAPRPDGARAPRRSDRAPWAGGRRSAQGSGPGCADEELPALGLGPRATAAAAGYPGPRVACGPQDALHACCGASNSIFVGAIEPRPRRPWSSSAEPKCLQYRERARARPFVARGRSDVLGERTQQGIARATSARCARAGALVVGDVGESVSNCCRAVQGAQASFVQARVALQALASQQTTAALRSPP
eukprot:scaffold1882_cov384-Prasinococcus_capsulatus_cf.AAC.3